MKVLITKSSNPQFWYSDKIGQSVEVYLDPSYPDKYICKQRWKGIKRAINRLDAEIIIPLPA